MLLKNKWSQLNPQMYKGEGGCHPPPPTLEVFDCLKQQKDMATKRKHLQKTNVPYLLKWAPRRLLFFSCGACLKIRRYKEIFSTVYLPSVRKHTVCNRCVFSLYIHLLLLFGNFLWSLQSIQISLFPSITSLFWRKDLPSAVLDFLYSGLKLYGIPRISAASGTRRLFEGGTY